MKTFRCKKLGVILRVHGRATYLEDIFFQVKKLCRGREGLLVVCFDRASQEVIRTVDRLLHKMTKNVEVITTESPIPARSSAGEAWVAGIAHSHAFLKAHECDVGALIDDDCLFSDLHEVRAHLDFFEHDRVECVWAHLWDSLTQENVNIPEHRAAALFRCYPDDEWATHYGAHCPHFCAQSENMGWLNQKVLHHGYLTNEDRELSWFNAKASGKIDAHSMSLIREAVVRELE